jgi:hypothetical protein
LKSRVEREATLTAVIVTPVLKFVAMVTKRQDSLQLSNSQKRRRAREKIYT